MPKRTNFESYGDDAAYITQGFDSGKFDGNDFDAFINKHSDWIEWYQKISGRPVDKVKRNLRTNYKNVYNRYVTWKKTGAGTCFD